MPIYLIERENSTVAVVEAANAKQAIVEYAESEGLSARVASKEDLFHYMLENGALTKPVVDERQRPLPLPEEPVVGTLPDAFDPSLANPGERETAERFAQTG